MADVKHSGETNQMSVSDNKITDNGDPCKSDDSDEEMRADVGGIVTTVTAEVELVTSG